MTRVPAAVALLVLLAACEAPRCQSSVSQRVPAPDGAHDAVVYHRSCAAGEGSNTEVAVLPHGADLPDVPTTVLTLSDSVAVAAHWASASDLALSYPANAHVIARVNRSSEGVAVVYASPSAAPAAPRAQ